MFLDGFESGSVCEWSPLVGAECLCFDSGLGQLRPIVPPAAGQLVISEWMPDPTLVSDATGEWFEVKALVAVDLNGLQAGTTTLLGTPVVPASGDCLHLEANALALLARSAGGENGQLPPVDATFAFGLLNANGTLQIGIANAQLDMKTWAASTAGKSIMIDSDGSQCTAPAGVPLYNGVDVGTPSGMNSPPECP